MMRTGPIPDGFISELEALKWRLADLRDPRELSAAEAAALGNEISAIRLHLKRLAADRQALRQEPPASDDAP